MDKIFPPTRYDKAPYRQIVRVKDEEGAGEEYYIQLSKDEEHPSWELVGDFLLKAFKQELSDASFVEDCIRRAHAMD
jgi:hypothetical protein